MALHYLDEEEAEKRCELTLTPWVEMFGYRGCHSARKTKAAVADTKIWAAGSATARELMKFVETSEVEVFVVGMRGGFQSFTDLGVDQRLPTVYIDLDGRLDTYVRGPHQLSLNREQCYDQNVPKVILDNRIALLHEFGHAKQFIENPLLFKGHYKTRDADTGRPRKFAVRAQGFADPLLYPHGPPTTKVITVKGSNADRADTFARAIRKRAEEVHGVAAKDDGKTITGAKGEASQVTDGGWLLSEEELNEFKPVPGGYALRIESDNMARHEWPICDELWIGRRLNYRDMSAWTTAQDSQTSTILKRLAEKKSKDQPVVSKYASGEVVCPRCGKTVMERTLNFACNHPAHRSK